jgi:hypothetical protein
MSQHFRKYFILLFLASFILLRTVPLVQGFYEFNKPYYHPGDTGYFLVEVINNQPSYVDITEATLNITDIGSYKWDPTANTSDLNHATIMELPLFDAKGNSYAHVNGCRIEAGGSAVFRVYFQIPHDALKGNYQYYFFMPRVTDIPVDIRGIINIYPEGETPQPGPYSDLFLVGLLSTFVLSPIYLVLRRRKVKAAKYVKIALIMAVLLLFVALLLSFLEGLI